MTEFLGLVDMNSEICIASPWEENGNLSGFVCARQQYMQIREAERRFDPRHLVYQRFQEIDAVSRFLDHETGSRSWVKCADMLHCRSVA